MRDIVTIDCNYLGRPRLAAAYLIVDGDEAAFVDNNTCHAVPALLEALERTGLPPEQVRYLIVTHVHLDHAGGTSALSQACPNATILAHPRAAPHIVDPSKLVKSATAVYGEDTFRRLYGTIEPVSEARVRALEDEASVSLGQRTLEFLHTRGHANHHFCIADSHTRSIFAGDAFGLHYPDLQGPGLFAYPSTSPTDFDADLAKQAVRRLVDLSPETIYPTHFGAVVDIERAADQLIRQLDFAGQLVEEAFSTDLPDDALLGYVEPRLASYFAGLLDAHGPLRVRKDVEELIRLDIDLNAQGIAYAANKRRRKNRESAA